MKKLLAFVLCSATALIAASPAAASQVEVTDQILQLNQNQAGVPVGLFQASRHGESVIDSQAELTGIATAPGSYQEGWTHSGAAVGGKPRGRGGHLFEFSSTYSSPEWSTYMTPLVWNSSHIPGRGRPAALEVDAAGISSPSYAPGGARILYGARDSGGQLKILVYHYGAEPSVAEVPGIDGLEPRNPVFGPNGLIYASGKGRDGRPDIFRIHPNTGKARNLTNSKRSERHPAVNGRKVAFSLGSRIGIQRIRRIDGSFARRTIDVSGSGRPTSLRFASDPLKLFYISKGPAGDYTDELMVLDLQSRISEGYGPAPSGRIWDFEPWTSTDCPFRKAARC